MSLSSSALASLLRSDLLGDSNASVVDNAQLTAFCSAIGTGVVNHIAAASIVLPGTFVSPNGGGAVSGLSAVTGLVAATMASGIAAGLPAAGASGTMMNNLATAIATPVCSHIMSSGIVLATGLVASGVVVSGQTSVTGLSSSTLATSLRSSILSGSCGAVDNAALTSLANQIASAVVSHVGGSGVVLGTGFACSPTGGPLTGFSKVS